MKMMITSKGVQSFLRRSATFLDNIIMISMVSNENRADPASDEAMPYDSHKTASKHIEFVYLGSKRGYMDLFTRAARNRW